MFKLPYRFQAIWLAWKRTPLALQLFLLATMLVLINYESRIIVLPPWARGLAGLNRVVVQVLYAFLTGYIFYFIIDYLSLERKKVSLTRMINNSVLEIDRMIRDLIEVIASRYFSESKNLTFEDFCIACQASNVHTTRYELWYTGNKTCKETVLLCLDTLKRNVDEVFIFYDLLDDRWAASLSNILDNIKRIERGLDVNGLNSNLHIVASALWNNFIEAKRLSDLNREYGEKYYLESREKTSPGSYIPAGVTFPFIAAKK